MAHCTYYEENELYFSVKDNYCVLNVVIVWLLYGLKFIFGRGNSKVFSERCRKVLYILVS